MPLPKGYTLDAPRSQSGLPAGYTLDAPAAPTAPQPQPKPKPQQSGVDAFLDASGASQLGHAMMHPLSTVATLLDAGRRFLNPNQPQRMVDNPNPIIAGIGNAIDQSKRAIQQGVEDYRRTGLSQQTRRDFGRAIPIVGPGLDLAQQQHDTGNDSAAVGTLLGTATGLAAPKLLEAAPQIISAAARGAGETAEESGVTRMDRFLTGGTPLDELKLKGKIAADAQPGLRVLQEGPGVSVTTSRAAQVPKLKARLPVRGQEVQQATAASTATVPWSDVRNVVDETITAKKSVAAGPGGNPNLPPRLDQLRTTFEPAIDSQGDASMSDLYAGRRAMDRNIDWNRGPDPVDATVRNATRQIRGGVKRLMYDADPSLVEPNERYADLATAAKLATKNAGLQSEPVISLKRIIPAVGSGAGAGVLTHNPALGAFVGGMVKVIPPVLDHPLTQTGMAAGLYQGGRVLQRLGQAVPALRTIPELSFIPLLAQGAANASALKQPESRVGDEREYQDRSADVFQQQSQDAPSTSPTIIRRIRRGVERLPEE